MNRTAQAEKDPELAELKASEGDQKILDEFLNANRLFLGPEASITYDHKMSPRSEWEDRVLSAGIDPHEAATVRERITAALDESHTMIEQMGAAPGAKWGDFVAGVYTETGDLSVIAPYGVLGFAACCHYPVKFIRKYWANEPTVGINDGDGFIHNDARYGGIHNTDQSLVVPLFWKGRRIAWLGTTIHEGENGSTEPGGMPAAAESRFDEGLKMSPFKIIENFKVKRDLMTFLQNSVRDPKLQHEDLKVKLHCMMRLRERMIRILEEFGEDLFVGTLRKHLEDTEAEVRRRIRELPDGTTRIVTFSDSTLREVALLKFVLSITVKGDKMTLDFRGSAPEFFNRSINTHQAGFKSMLLTCYLQCIWPDLPKTMSVFSPIDIVFDEHSMLNASDDAPHAMSVVALYKATTIPTVPMVKLSYGVPEQYTATIAPQYDQPATLIYGGVTQHGDYVGNFCADINGSGQGGRLDCDGEHAVSPPFAAVCDLGEMELMEEDLPIVRLGAFTLAKDRVGFGKYRGGLGYEQIATFRGSPLWGFLTGCGGSRFIPSAGLFGGYGPPAYPLCKIKKVNVFEELKRNPEKVPFDIVKLMNGRDLEGAVYGTFPMGITFDLAQPGEVYMICQGAGGGYGDVLLRDPALVVKDIEEDLISPETARDIYKVVFDVDTGTVDEQATQALRQKERQARIARGKRFDEFVAEWVTPEPAKDLPYFGSWNDPAIIYGIDYGQRVEMHSSQMRGMFMLNPKDLRIAKLEAQLRKLGEEPDGTL